jgi:hypothetical protein
LPTPKLSQTRTRLLETLFAETMRAEPSIPPL